MKAPMTDLLWRGPETAEAAAAAVLHHADVALNLPASFHHAIVARFCASSTPDVLEQVDVSGGAELVRALSRIRGLEDLAVLAMPVARAHARVRLVSPSPTVAIRAADSTRVES